MADAAGAALDALTGLRAALRFRAGARAPEGLGEPMMSKLTGLLPRPFPSAVLCKRQCLTEPWHCISFSPRTLHAGHGAAARRHLPGLLGMPFHQPFFALGPGFLQTVACRMRFARRFPRLRSIVLPPDRHDGTRTRVAGTWSAGK